MKRAYADRSKYMAAPDFADIPLTGLLSKDYATHLRESIDPEAASSDVSPGNPAAYEGASTTHVSIMDKEGNIVSLTQTIECFFGSGVVIPGTGILLNDQMHDYTPRPGTANSVEPGKQPLSSMVFKRRLRPLGSIAREQKSASKTVSLKKYGPS